MNQSSIGYVHSCYSTQSWRETYATEVMPVPDPCDWCVPSEVASIVVGTPSNPKQAGRPRVNRFQAGDYVVAGANGGAAGDVISSLSTVSATSVECVGESVESLEIDSNVSGADGVDVGADGVAAGADGHAGSSVFVGAAESVEGVGEPVAPKVSRECSRCHKKGHYQTTCTAFIEINPEEGVKVSAKRPRKQKSCGICGVVGHTCTTCTDPRRFE